MKETGKPGNMGVNVMFTRGDRIKFSMGFHVLEQAYKLTEARTDTPGLYRLVFGSRLVLDLDVPIFLCKIVGLKRSPYVRMMLV